MKKIYSLLAMLLPSVAVMAQLNVANVTSNSNGTLNNITDDYITFSMNPVAPVPNYVTPYTYTVTATQGGLPVAVTMSDGTAATNVRYAAYVQYFSLPAGSAGKGNVVITVDPNWGSFANTTGTLTDPGTTAINPCAMSGSVTYRYQSPTAIADAEDWQARVPKFNVPGKTLTGVSINLTTTAYSIGVSEGRSPSNGLARQTMFTEPTVSVNGVNNTMNTLTVFNTPFETLGAAVLVPAAGSWPGDNMTDPTRPSTLVAMEDHYNLLSNSAFSFLDPRLSSQWVTNIPGIPATADDDILVGMGTATETVAVPVTAASISAFTGSGNAPIQFSTRTSHTITGGGGNAVVRFGTSMSFSVEVTYTYTSVSCQPVSGSVYLDQDGLANGIKNQGKFTGSVAMGLKAVLADVNGIVIDVVNVDGAGNYTFAGIVPSAGYTVRITTQAAITKGAPAPAPTLGTGAAYTYLGEFNGAGTGNDGSPDGISASFTVGASPATQVDFAINNATSLSANFTDLFAEIKGGQLSINFTTLGEVNNDHFEVEASKDGVNFVKIGEINSKAVNGTSNSVLQYDFATSNSSALLLGAGILILGFGGIYSRRKYKMVLGAITIIGFIALLASCSKENDEVSLSGTDVMVRIAQVDKDGTKTYSKTVKAIRK